MQRALTILTLLALAAQPAYSQTLAPGKPAGTTAAQHISYNTGFIGISIVAVVLTFGLPSTGTSTTITSVATTS